MKAGKPRRMAASEETKLTDTLVSDFRIGRKRISVVEATQSVLRQPQQNSTSSWSFGTKIRHFDKKAAASWVDSVVQGNDNTRLY